MVCGGERVTPSAELADGFYISPCILSNCTDDMSITKEEVFGSVMSVMAFRMEDEVIRRANDTPFGLAAGVFTKCVFSPFTLFVDRCQDYLSSLFLSWDFLRSF